MTSARPRPLVLQHHPALFTEIWFVDTYLTWARVPRIYEETVFGGIFFPLQIPFNWILSEIPENK